MGDNAEKVTKEIVKKKVKVYKDLLKELLKKCKIAKGKLDMYHCTLYKLNSAIQLTVIYFSATSTFLQALTSDTKEATDQITNITIDDQTIEEDIQVYDDITLIITSYSSLIIALARHFKIEERVGNVYNLIDRFAEIVSRIQYDLEILKPWEKEDYFTDGKEDEWNAVDQNMKKEYNQLIDIKKDMFTSYGKIIGTSIYGYYQKLFDALNINYVDEEDQLVRNVKKSTCCCKFSWFCCCKDDTQKKEGKKIEEEAKKAEEEKKKKIATIAENAKNATEAAEKAEEKEKNEEELIKKLEGGIVKTEKKDGNVDAIVEDVFEEALSENNSNK